MKKTLSIIFMAIFLSSCFKTDSTRPNIIIIMADDMGYEAVVANGGSSYKTPELDKLAHEGIRFEHCYAQPLCTPSRVKLMTGMYNVHNYVRFGYLDTTQTTYGHLFQDAGYATCVIGKWQLGKDLSSPYKAGFDEYCLWQVSKGRTDSTNRDTRFSKPVLESNGKVKTYYDDNYGPKVVSEYGIDFIKRSTKANQPFLLYYPMILTHCPFSPTPDSEEWMKDTSAVMTYKGDAGYFGDMVAYTDKIIGNIQNTLKELGIADNTFIIFTGDNGTDVPVVSTLNVREVIAGKGKSTDAGTRVPLIVKWPNTIRPGEVSTDLIDLSDVFPTICGAAEIDIPKELNLDGRSFLPQLQGLKGQPREWVYNWYARSGNEEEARIFIRNHRYKLYDSGEFYEVPGDYMEQNALDVKALSPKLESLHSDFKGVLDHYKKRRLIYVRAQ